MEKLNCIIIDDEPIAVNYLKAYVEKVPQLNLLAGFNKAADAYELLSSGKVQLLFIDIQMPQITGLEFIRTLQNPPKIILTTAYSEYALEAFELSVSDYLLKPISFERFVQAVMKVIQSQTPAMPASSEQQKSRKDFMFLKAGYKSYRINFKDITHVEAMKEYVVFYTKDGKKYMKNERIKNVEENLAEFDFIRVHKSFIVSLQHIDSFYGNSIEIGEHTIPVGRVYKDEVKKLLEG